MSAVVIKTHALAKLKEAIEAGCAKLIGKVVAGHAEREVKMIWPVLAIHPRKYRAEWHSRTLVASPSSSSAIWKIGSWDALVKLRLGAATERERETLGEDVLACFFGDGTRPGFLRTVVDTAHNQEIVWELEEDAWVDEFAFDKKWFSELLVTARIPILVRQDGVHDMTDLRLSLTSDLETEYAQLPAAQVEAVRINADGTLTKL